MSDESDAVLNNTISAALTATKDADNDPSHERLRFGLHALLLCEKARMEKKTEVSSLQVGPFKATGWAVIVVAIVYLSLKTHGLIP